MSYNSKVYRPQGADQLIVADGGTIVIQDGGIIEVESGGEISIASGGKITAAGTQALTIAALKVNYTTADLDTEAEIIAAINATNTAINALIAAAKGVGIIAAS